MNEIITMSEDARYPVNGRMLHERLEIGTAYKDWFPRMCEYGFVEGKDFNSLKNERVQIEGGREVIRVMTDHHLTLSMAKEICMLQRTDKGREVRQYLISVEEQWNSPALTMARALKMADVEMKRLGGEVARLKEQAERDAPKVLFAECVSASDDSILVGTLAKLLTQNGVKIGQNRLFQRLREDGHLCSTYGERYNLPTQRAMEMKLFAVKENTISTAQGDVVVKPTVKVTGKGQVHFLNRYGTNAMQQSIAR